MWRQNIFSDNPNSDHSISEDEEDVEMFNDVVSLNASGSVFNKEELSLPARLDLLKGMRDENLAGKASGSSFEKPAGSPFDDDEVEMPDFKDAETSNISGEIVANSSDEEVISDDESHKYGHFGASISKFDRLPEIFKAVDPGASATSDGNYLEDDGKIEINSDTEPVESEAHAHGVNLPSMADLFDKMQDKTSLYFAHDSQRRGKTGPFFQKRSRFQSLNTIVDSEGSPEPVGSGSSSDNEVSEQKLKITSPGKKMQTIADRFQEALGSSSVIDDGTNIPALNSFRAGIFEKLQQVMQKEKETDMDFWKQLQTGASKLGSVDIKIVSRYLDGKLTVCVCSFSKNIENFPLLDSSKGTAVDGREGRQVTIIFNPRVCDNVDLEVGNMIRILPPWKEVQVGNDNIILCTYFSQIPPTF
ncbi:hypothetical protein Lalb_Chr18g0047211 [Lupinus albus]|uniref:Uncharacterized protein n=1 Tax=Lupinus albus TaxID=3870 RepID=A0A6A4P2N5_LUPAL|nr:hypothetical protein Lalb_Chr18g0047211 [Lupinus albus]